MILPLWLIVGLLVLSLLTRPRPVIVAPPEDAIDRDTLAGIEIKLAHIASLLEQVVKNTRIMGAQERSEAEDEAEYQAALRRGEKPFPPMR